MDTKVIEESISNKDTNKLLEKRANLKPINTVIKQKDNLISYLKDTVNNLTNIIVNNTTKMENLNQVLNDYINDNERYTEELFKYETEQITLKQHINAKSNTINQLTDKLEELNDAYEKINRNYIDNIKRHIETKNRFIYKIDSLKDINETIKKNYKHRLEMANSKLETPSKISNRSILNNDNISIKLDEDTDMTIDIAVNNNIYTLPIDSDRHSDSFSDINIGNISDSNISDSNISDSNISDSNISDSNNSDSNIINTWVNSEINNDIDLYHSDNVDIV